MSIATTITRSPPILARPARMAGSWPRYSIDEEHRAEAHSSPEGAQPGLSVLTSWRVSVPGGQPQLDRSTSSVGSSWTAGLRLG